MQLTTEQRKAVELRIVAIRRVIADPNVKQRTALVPMDQELVSERMSLLKELVLLRLSLNANR